jgi:hypothetical protein
MFELNKENKNNFNVVCVVNTQSVVVLHSTKSKLRSCEVPFSNTIIIRGSNKIMHNFFTYSLWSNVFGQNDCLLYISCKTTFCKNIIPKSTLVRF